MEAIWHAVEALRSIANQRCYRRNCGTTCLCSACHARVSLMTFDPEFIPKYTGRESEYVEQARQVQHAQGRGEIARDSAESTEAF